MSIFPKLLNMFNSFSLLFHMSIFTLHRSLGSVHAVLLCCLFLINYEVPLQADDQTTAKTLSKYAHVLLTVFCTTRDLF